jgi:hypothetical protein
MRRTRSVLVGSVVSLLFLTSALLWFLSYDVQFHTARAGETRHLFFDSAGGVLTVQWMSHPSARKPQVGRHVVEPFFRPDEVLADFNLPRPRARPVYGVSAGAGNFTAHDPTSNWSYRIVHVSWWLVTAVTGVAFAGWLVTVIRRRRMRRAHGLPSAAPDAAHDR